MRLNVIPGTQYLIDLASLLAPDLCAKLRYGTDGEDNVILASTDGNEAERGLVARAVRT